MFFYIWVLLVSVAFHSQGYAQPYQVHSLVMKCDCYDEGWFGRKRFANVKIPMLLPVFSERTTFNSRLQDEMIAKEGTRYWAKKACIGKAEELKESGHVFFHQITL